MRKCMIPLCAISIHRHNLSCMGNILLDWIVVFPSSSFFRLKKECSIFWRHTLDCVACNILEFLITDIPLCLSYSITDINFPRLSAWVLDWWCSLMSQQLFHDLLILERSLLSLSCLLCHVFITVITRLACKKNNWSRWVCLDQVLICVGPTVEPCGVPQRWLS